MPALSPITPENRALCLKAVDRIDELVARGDGTFPSVIETAWQMLNDTEVLVSEVFYNDGSVKERKLTPRVSDAAKVKIAKMFLDFAAVKEMKLADHGLGKKSGTKVTLNNPVLVFNKSEAEIAAMPPEAREMYLGLNRDALAAAARARE